MYDRANNAATIPSFSLERRRPHEIHSRIFPLSHLTHAYFRAYTSSTYTHTRARPDTGGTQRARRRYQRFTRRNIRAQRRRYVAEREGTVQGRGRSEWVEEEEMEVGHRLPRCDATSRHTQATPTHAREEPVATERPGNLFLPEVVFPVHSTNPPRGPLSSFRE